MENQRITFGFSQIPHTLGALVAANESLSILGQFPSSYDRTIAISVSSAPGQLTGDGVVAGVHSQLSVANGEGNQVILGRMQVSLNFHFVNSTLGKNLVIGNSVNIAGGIFAFNNSSAS